MRLFLASLLALCPVALLAGDSSWSASSPDKKCQISVQLNSEGALSYEVRRAGKPVILRSPLGLRRHGADFDTGLSLVTATSTKTRREAYDLFTGPKARVDNLLNRRTLSFRTPSDARLDIDLAAGNEGVAFRYRFPDSSRDVHVLDAELTGFNVSSRAKAWLQPYHAAGPYTPAYEDFYFQVSPGELPPDSRGKAIGWGFPALFHVPEASTWLLLTESGTGPAYCACHLAPNSEDGLYKIAFPANNEFTKGQTNNLTGAPRHTLPWEMPWRVLVMGGSAGDIALATLTTDLAPPSRIGDSSWIKPGRASWAWWSYPDGPNSTAIFNQFTDFAARMKWEYTLFDAGWWEPGLKPLASHARSKSVAPLAWCFAGDFYDPAQRKKKLDEVSGAGISGVKVDFWCSDRQEAIAAIHGLFEEAAARRMIVNLHGCTIPRGWQRTWPNFLAAEAVLGTECYFYEPHYTDRAAELNTILPFTRNAIGPMDATPVACSPKKYARTTTAAHELATALVFTSGLIHYADKPEFFETLPVEAIEVLRDAPARWDETRCLEGEPGRLVVFARRAGREWFVAGLSGSKEAISLNLDLRAFKKFPERFLIQESANDPSMQVSSAVIPASNRLAHTLPPRGGFILRMRR